MKVKLSRFTGAQRDHEAVNAPQLRSFLLLPAFAVASPKPAAMHDRRRLPGRAVLLMERSDDLPGAALLLLWLQGRGEAEDGVRCSDEAEEDNPSVVTPKSAALIFQRHGLVCHLSYAGTWRFSSSMRRRMTSSHLPWIFSAARSSFGVH